MKSAQQHYNEVYRRWRTGGATYQEVKKAYDARERENALAEILAAEDRGVLAQLGSSSVFSVAATDGPEQIRVAYHKLASCCHSETMRHALHAKYMELVHEWEGLNE